MLGKLVYQKENKLFCLNKKPNALLAFCIIISLWTALWTDVALAEDVRDSSATPNSGSDEEQTYFRSAGNRPSGPQPIGELLQEGPTGGIWQRAQLLGNMGGI